MTHLRACLTNSALTLVGLPRVVKHTLKKCKKNFLSLINSKQFQKCRYLAPEGVPKKLKRKSLHLLTKGYWRPWRRRRKKKIYQNSLVTTMHLNPMASQKNVAVSERRTRNILNEHNRKLKKLKLVWRQPRKMAWTWRSDSAFVTRSLPSSRVLRRRKKLSSLRSWSGTTITTFHSFLNFWCSNLTLIPVERKFWKL